MFGIQQDSLGWGERVVVDSRRLGRVPRRLKLMKAGIDAPVGGLFLRDRSEPRY